MVIKLVRSDFSYAPTGLVNFIAQCANARETSFSVRLPGDQSLIEFFDVTRSIDKSAAEDRINLPHGIRHCAYAIK